VNPVGKKTQTLMTTANFLLWHSVFVLPFNDYWMEESPVASRVYCILVIISVGLLNVIVIRRGRKQEGFSLKGYILFVLLFPLLCIIIIGIFAAALREGLY
jgi:hypothetical protein